MPDFFSPQIYWALHIVYPFQSENRANRHTLAVKHFRKVRHRQQIVVHLITEGDLI